MVLFKHASDLVNYIDSQRKKGAKTGFVPTMGALHEGHISLCRQAKSNEQLCVASIFVNPTQFNDPADFKKYPITIENDIDQLVSAGCDVLFLPSVDEIYPGGTSKVRHYDLGYLETILEGYYRPGHFQGVCMVVHRLLEIVRPDALYIGQKDFQQCMVIKKLVGLIGMQDTTKVNISPTLREPDGLAMSSRNMRLDPEERKKANGIYHALCFIRDNIKAGDLKELKHTAIHMLEKNGFKVDYVEIANAESLKLVDHWDGKENLVAVAAAFLNNIRLIDNILLK